MCQGRCSMQTSYNIKEKIQMNITTLEQAGKHLMDQGVVDLFVSLKGKMV